MQSILHLKHLAGTLYLGRLGQVNLPQHAQLL